MFARHRVQRIGIDLNKFFFIKWLHHEKEDIRNKWKILSTFTDIVVTYFVLVNIQLGRKKLYRNDNELANQSIQGGKYCIFLAIKLLYSSLDLKQSYQDPSCWLFKKNMKYDEH